MVQTRIVEYGALVQSSDMPTVIANIMAPGRLEGMAFSATANNILSISPGTVLLPDGVMISEDQTKSLVINNTAFATNYTVTYQFQSADVIGGSPATLNLLTGIVKQESLSDSTVLGWILYPGGSVALDTSMFVQPRPVRVSPPKGVFSSLYLPPFVDALRPPTERAGAVAVRSSRFANLNSPSTQATAFAGTPARVLGASVLTDTSAVQASGLSYDTFTVSHVVTVTGNIVNGSPVISNLSDVSRLAVGQTVGNGNNGIPNGATVIAPPSGNSVTISAQATATVSGGYLTFGNALFTGSTQSSSLLPGSPLPLTRVPNLPLSAFVIGPSDALTVSTQTTASPPPGVVPGAVEIVAEVPARSGNWQETVMQLGSETVMQFLNLSPQTLTYDFRLPFVVSGAGKPNKVVTRLSVDFNCIVTYSILVGGQALILSPVSGTVANTGGLITQEFSIPTLTSTKWSVGAVAYIDVSIQAQSGGSASFAYVGLTLDDAPYLLFVGSTD